MNRTDELKMIVQELEVDLDKFYEKSNKAAGRRARKSLQNLKFKAQQIRSEIIEISDSDCDSYRSFETRLQNTHPDDPVEESGGSDDW